MANELDYMEYANDGTAQAAYVTDGGYGSDFLTGGTASGDSEFGGFVASNAVDGNTGTYWHSDNSGFSHWWKYDLGAGVTKIASKIRIYPREYDGVSAIKDFTIQGSNNDSSWTTLHTGQHTNAIAWEDFVFSNSTEYRYYKIEITSIWSGSDNYTIISEIEMMELSLESYSESSIKTQGSYSLKGIGLITVSLNETLTKTF